MEALGAAASIIAVLQITNGVISVCYDYKALIKGTPWALTQTITELQDLRYLLETLDRVAEQKDDLPSLERQKHTRSLELLCGPESGPLTTCRLELEHLGNVIGLDLNDASLSKRKALLRAMQWQFKDKEVKQCLERIDRCKATLTLAITADEVALLRNLQDMSYIVASDLNKMSGNLDTFAQKVQDKETLTKHKNITEWLSPVDPSESHDTALGAHQPGTNNWFVEGAEFKKWTESTDSFLWVSGFPGAGKTTLFANCIKHLRDSRPSWFLGYFYCDFRRNETQDVINIMGSVVAQICSQSGFFPEQLGNAYDQGMSRPGQKQRPTLSLLSNAFKTITERYDMVMLLDALDECQQTQEACEFLTQLQKSCQNIRILVTSRGTAEIQAGLSSYPKLQLERHMDEVNEDIDAYINHRLSTAVQLQWLPIPVKEDIASHLTEKSEGMFRWVQCQIDGIEKLRTVKAIRNALQRLPKGLNETYANILSSVEEADIDLVRRILLWVSFTVFPVTLSEVYEAIAIESNLDHLDEESLLARPQDILDLCGSLISMSEHGPLRLAHLSVREYLMGPELRKAEGLAVFALDAKTASHELAVNSISYLSFKEMASGPCRTFEAYAHRMKRYPLLSYASVSWTYFVRGATFDPELRSLVLNFFSAANRATFMSWVQVLNAVHGTRRWDYYPKHATPLYYAASFGLLEAVEDMIQDPNVDLNAPGSRFGGTALHAAVLRAHFAVMRALLDARADPNKGDFSRLTPLLSAASYGYEEAVRMLLDYGASVDILAEINMSPVDVAQLSGHDHIVKLLVDLTGVAPKSRRAPSSPTESDDPSDVERSATFPMPPPGSGRVHGRGLKYIETIQALRTRLSDPERPPSAA